MKQVLYAVVFLFFAGLLGFAIDVLQENWIMLFGKDEEPPVGDEDHLGV